jgi:hypothetical protein
VQIAFDRDDGAPRAQVVQRDLARGETAHIDVGVS